MNELDILDSLSINLENIVEWEKGVEHSVINYY